MTDAARKAAATAPGRPAAGPGPGEGAGRTRESGSDPFWRATYEVARNEALQLLRTKRLLGVAVAVLLTMVLLTIVFPLVFLDDLTVEADSEGVAVQNLIFLFFLSGFFFLSGYFFLQLLGILLTSDAVSSEWSRKTLFLLLSKPVPREAFVLGKYGGAAVTLGATVGVLLLVDYFAMTVLLPGFPDLTSFGRFLAAAGLLVLGVLAYAAVALFCSTLTRSTVAGMLLAVVLWIVVFPLLARLDLFVALARHGADTFSMSAQEAGMGWSQYLSPGSSMRAASEVLVPGDLAGFFRFFSDGMEADPGMAAVALLVHIVVFVCLAVLVVRVRNFE